MNQKNNGGAWLKTPDAVIALGISRDTLRRRRLEGFLSMGNISSKHHLAGLGGIYGILTKYKKSSEHGRHHKLVELQNDSNYFNSNY